MSKEGRGRRGKTWEEILCACNVCVRALTVPGSPDNIHVLLKVLDDLCQDAVLPVNVLQDLSPVVDVATS